jgi:hypothetical protein
VRSFLFAKRRQKKKCSTGTTCCRRRTVLYWRWWWIWLIGFRGREAALVSAWCRDKSRNLLLKMAQGVAPVSFLLWLY